MADRRGRARRLGLPAHRVRGGGDLRGGRRIRDRGSVALLPRARRCGPRGRRPGVRPGHAARAVGAADRPARAPRAPHVPRASDRAGRLPRVRLPRRREGAARARRAHPEAGLLRRLVGVRGRHARAAPRLDAAGARPPRPRSRCGGSRPRLDPRRRVSRWRGARPGIAIRAAALAARPRRGPLRGLGARCSGGRGDRRSGRLVRGRRSARPFRSSGPTRRPLEPAAGRVLATMAPEPSGRPHAARARGSRPGCRGGDREPSSGRHLLAPGRLSAEFDRNY